MNEYPSIGLFVSSFVDGFLSKSRNAEFIPQPKGDINIALNILLNALATETAFGRPVQPDAGFG